MNGQVVLITGAASGIGAATALEVLAQGGVPALVDCDAEPLAAMAALRSGAGLVELLVPDPVAAIAAGFDPCVMTRGLPAGPDGTFAAAALPEIGRRAAAADAVAIGPGRSIPPDSWQPTR